jgi:opacity protein-like surface antigen
MYASKINMQSGLNRKCARGYPGGINATDLAGIMNRLVVAIFLIVFCIAPSFCADLRNDDDYVAFDYQDLPPRRHKESDVIIKRPVALRQEILAPARQFIFLHGTMQSIRMHELNSNLSDRFTGIHDSKRVSAGYGVGGMVVLKIPGGYMLRPRIEWGSAEKEFNFDYYGNGETDFAKAPGSISLSVNYAMYGFDFLTNFTDNAYVGVGVGRISADYHESFSIMNQETENSCKGSSLMYNIFAGVQANLSRGLSVFGELYYRHARINELQDAYRQPELFRRNVPFELDFSGIGLTAGLAFGGK